MKNNLEKKKATLHTMTSLDHVLCYTRLPRHNTEVDGVAEGRAGQEIRGPGEAGDITIQVSRVITAQPNPWMPYAILME